MKIKQTLAGMGVALAILGGGATACGNVGSGGGGYSDAGYVDEVQYGYYDSHHHYHYYSHPKQVRVTHKQYTSHRYEYSPHGTQHKVTVKHTTTTTHHSNGTTTTTHKRTVTRRSTTHTTTRRYGTSRKR